MVAGASGEAAMQDLTFRVCYGISRYSLETASPLMLTPATAAPEFDAPTRRSIAFLNWAHALDHFVLLIYPTIVIGLEVIYGRPYSELIALSTAAFVAFGVFSLPAGWIGDHWSRRNMM